jgi:hypothetical protein
MVRASVIGDYAASTRAPVRENTEVVGLIVESVDEVMLPLLQAAAAGKAL